MTITVIKGCDGDTPLTPHEVVTTFKVVKGERTAIPDIVVGSCGCRVQSTNGWAVNSGDATLDYDVDANEWYITANGDATIFVKCVY